MANKKMWTIAVFFAVMMVGSISLYSQEAEAEKRGESVSIDGTVWRSGRWSSGILYGDGLYGASLNRYLQFNADGTFSGGWEHDPYDGRDSKDQTYDYSYSGTYTLNGYKIYLSGTRTTTINHYKVNFWNGKVTKDSSYPGSSRSYTETCEIVLMSHTSPMYIKWQGKTLFAH